MTGSMPRQTCATLAAVRQATTADHDSVDRLVDPARMVDSGYYAAVMGGLIAAAEVIETTLPLIPSRLWSEGLSPAEVSKRVAIDAESAFLDDLAGSPEVRRPRPEMRPAPEMPMLASGGSSDATMLGILYVYVGSGLGGLHLLRFVRSASWWRHDREDLFLRPYGAQLKQRWQAVRSALDDLGPDGRGDAVEAARAGFGVHRRALIAHLQVRGNDG